jgi:hypothetical protein
MAIGIDIVAEGRFGFNVDTATAGCLGLPRVRPNKSVGLYLIGVALSPCRAERGQVTPAERVRALVSESRSKAALHVCDLMDW